MTVVVVTYVTESGDRGVLGVFASAPSEEQLSELTRAGSDGWEEIDSEGPGDYGSFFFLDQDVCEVIE